MEKEWKRGQSVNLVKRLSLGACKLINEIEGALARKSQGNFGARKPDCRKRRGNEMQRVAPERLETAVSTKAFGLELMAERLKALGQIEGRGGGGWCYRGGRTPRAPKYLAMSLDTKVIITIRIIQRNILLNRASSGERPRKPRKRLRLTRSHHFPTT